jgi:hypothetical protein
VSSHYTVEVEIVDGSLPSMGWLGDVIEEALEGELHMTDRDYGIVVTGPPELNLVGIPR